MENFIKLSKPPPGMSPKGQTLIFTDNNTFFIEFYSFLHTKTRTHIYLTPKFFSCIYNFVYFFFVFVYFSLAPKKSYLFINSFLHILLGSVNRGDEHFANHAAVVHRFRNIRNNSSPLHKLKPILCFVTFF